MFGLTGGRICRHDAATWFRVENRRPGGATGRAAAAAKERACHGIRLHRQDTRRRSEQRHLTVDEHDDAWYRKYMGGAAMAMDYILREVPAEGRSARAGERAGLRRRPVDRHCHLRAEPDERQLQEPPLWVDRRCSGGRILPGRTEDGRVRRHRHQREVRQKPGLPLDQGWPVRAARRFRLLGHGDRAVRRHDHGASWATRGCRR